MRANFYVYIITCISLRVLCMVLFSFHASAILLFCVLNHNSHRLHLRKHGTTIMSNIAVYIRNSPSIHVCVDVLFSTIAL